jgi:two-component system, sensor histidine kinase
MMKNYIHSLPIKHKIIAISMITSIAVVSLASIAFIITQYSMNQVALVNSTSALAKITAVNSHAAVVFKDVSAGNEILTALAENPQIISAEIYLSDGTKFANYNSKLEEHQSLVEEIKVNEASEWDISGLKIKRKTHFFFSDYLDLDQEIRVDGKLLGYIDIRIDLSQLYNSLKWQALVTGIVFLVVSLLGFLLISWMQNFISEPISALTSTIQLISKKQDYTLRAEKYSNDELGVLTDGFNLMLEQIFQRDEELVKTFSKLKDANQLAEQASLAKSNFLASMSHEIRTPMNGVLGMANLLMQTKLNEKQLHYTKTIQISGKTLLTIINDILDFSKIEANKLNLEVEVFNPQNTLKELGQLFAERIKSSGIHYSTRISDDFPTSVIGDPNRLNQILYNLLGNAIKFTDEGQISIKCSREKSENNRILLCFEIKDNGSGISEEKQKHLFDAFFQAHKEKNWMKSGTGLGLAIAKKLCEAMGGSIGVTSKLGIGSTFWFSVWVKKANEKKSVSYKTNIDTSPPKAVKFGASILLAEDNIVNQDVAIGSLEYFGCQVTVANNGQEALELFAEKSYDLVLMDFSMPIMDGVTASKEIRLLEKQKNLNETPIVALTAHAVTGVQKQCEDAGMNDYLSKPFLLSQLLIVLKKWLPKP